MSERTEFLKEMGFSEKAIKYITDEVNIGKIENPSVFARYQGKCGDIIKIYLTIESDMIKDAGFQLTGCAGLQASGSALTEMIKGMSLEEAMMIDIQNVVSYLEGIPKRKYDCTEIAISALRKALKQYKEKIVGNKND